MNDRVMNVKPGVGETVVNIIYAMYVHTLPKWRQVDQELQTMQEGEMLIVGGDLYGDVGTSRDVNEKSHGCWGVGEKNE